MVTNPPIEVPSRFGRFVAWLTRALTVGAVAAQGVLLAIEVIWARRDHTPISEAAGRQGGLFAVTIVLAALVFWLTAQMRLADPLQRLRRSEGLRLAAIGGRFPAPEQRPHQTGG